MRILVTGTQGQVARSLLERGSERGYEIILLGRPHLDLASGRSEIVAAVERARPDAVVNAAAYTAVDKAEADEAAAFAINADGAGSVAYAAARLAVPLVHTSTDYVFDGLKPAAFRENDPVGPTSVYGRSKLDGERQVLAEHDNAAILRTAWVYSPFGANFVKTMLRLGTDREELRVVSDQLGNPTSALDIADGILKVVANLAADRDENLRGIFHMAGSESTNWAEFAEGIFATSAARGGPTARVVRIGSSDFPTAAKRPANSRLDCTKLQSAHQVSLPSWRTSLSDVVERLLPGDREPSPEQQTETSRLSSQG
ncbi:dTDP-4-dehydrorhamnose reductase [Sphingomonas piscis]|uniref:dTDP-4-dehydrorhamnose reductase n=1 Tax=Sphingomonas piscis TaxID=2714943 RepID=A0A6G7YMT4_9SPHN|nr:dTDP-4-dehydrorhamnose reductase [Sphingomonas piscis]QIK78053.1 dTDP-4-dehydrorhamnose reductase [Sphingomonas piscis]